MMMIGLCCRSLFYFLFLQIWGGGEEEAEQIGIFSTAIGSGSHDCLIPSLFQEDRWCKVNIYNAGCNFEKSS